MKNYIIFFVLILTGLTACEDSLDFQVKDRIILENFFQTEDDAIGSVTGIYDALIEKDMYKSNLWLIQDIASDDCDALSTWNDPNAHQLDRYTLQSTNNYITSTWRGAYLLISRANLSINRIPDVTMDEDLKSRLRAEAKFLRALSYFNLVRLYGAVPLILTTETYIDKYLVPRTSVDSVYAQIIDDLNSAADNLPESYT